MAVYISTDHAGFYPVGTASVVVAESEREARLMLMAALFSAGLDGKEPFTLQEIDITKPGATILRNGDY